MMEHNYKPQSIQRRDIYYADLSPVVGPEQGGIRLILIIQNDVGNRHSPTVIAAAITGYAKGRHQLTHAQLHDIDWGLVKDSTVLLEQTRTIDHARLGRRIGSLSQAEMERIDQALKISVELADTLNKNQQT